MIIAPDDGSFHEIHWETGKDGAVELVVRSDDGDPEGPIVELVRLGLAPQDLDDLLTEGRTRLWEALGV